MFVTFLKLGLTSFGGPVAHLGYFRDELVIRQRWIDEAEYADLVALCQFLPGPASSQVGFALGLLRGNGLRGGLVAWLGFTLPSAVILFAFALAATTFSGPLAQGFLHGLKLVAVAVVAQAVWGMARTLTPDFQRMLIAFVAAVITALLGGALAQIAAIAIGALLGLTLCRSDNSQARTRLHYPQSRYAGTIALLIFAVLLVLIPIARNASDYPLLTIFDAFYRSGALVFGGGHVVLPLLQAEVVAPGWVTDQSFLAGYGLAQAVPGPLFAFAAYLGAIAQPAPNALGGALCAIVCIFLPGLLLVYGMLPFWDALRMRPLAQAAMRGTNAAVVGILAVALYSPVCTSAIFNWRDGVLALGGFVLLTYFKLPSWIVVALLASAAMIIALV
ncbi:chromate efflux transporter [Pseudolysobacter antarcticus]|uniref:chromate efflux transporter n=1 Tax=Pseudolysobacter antarcticus TaxID=2511995 RepID=UPI00241467CA|nr:chromate efflux transporter [Pseudolysobacter antarcticus]